jgi:uncharacterized membrane protein (DUF2068 family)
VKERAEHPPGVSREKPQRFRPRFHYELLICGVSGHELVGLDARDVGPDDAVVVRQIGDVRWHRCLRCDSWLPVSAGGDSISHTRERPPSRDEIALPLRGKPLRDKIILRLIAINRGFHFLVLGALGTLVLVFAHDRGALRDTFYKVVADLQGGVQSGRPQIAEHGILHDIDNAFTTSSSNLRLLGVVLLIYAAVEGIEMVGLWQQRRWAEYMTFLVTTSLLPLEVYEIAEGATPFKIFAFLINVAVVAYLLYAKRLFGFRGGYAAEEEIKKRDIGWDALERATPALGPA